MNVIFLTNFLTHHQTPFCKNMFTKLNGRFWVVVMRSADEDQKRLGYLELNDKYKYVIKTYESKENENRAMKLCEDADVVIWGSADEKYVKKRLEKNKLTIIYTERLFKRGLHYALHPLMIKNLWNKYVIKRKKKQFYLCAGAYSARDINLFTHTPEKFYRWGYFPELNQHKDINKVLENKDVSTILWAGRLIEYKHPEVVIQVAKKLKNDGYRFNFNIIGNGLLEETLIRLVNEEKLNNYVHILGAMSPNNVQKHMEKAGIFMFTSNFNEGWGAVLNEAMGNGCAVVASHAIGAVPFLLNHKQNGLVYKYGDNIELTEYIRYLLDNKDEQQRLGKNAYQSLQLSWNIDTATERLLKLFLELENKQNCELFDDGPCSHAKIIKNHWIKKKEI